MGSSAMSLATQAVGGQAGLATGDESLKIKDKGNRGETVKKSTERKGKQVIKRTKPENLLPSFLPYSAGSKTHGNETPVPLPFILSSLQSKQQLPTHHFHLFLVILRGIA